MSPRLLQLLAALRSLPDATARDAIERVIVDAFAVADARVAEVERENAEWRHIWIRHCVDTQARYATDPAFRAFADAALDPPSPLQEHP